MIGTGCPCLRCSTFNSFVLDAPCPSNAVPSQDESVIPPSLAKALDRVRQGADIMPLNQLHQQLEKSFGADWRSKLSSFDETPIAAASIGQVRLLNVVSDTRDTETRLLCKAAQRCLRYP